MAQIVVGGQRIRDADPGEGDPSLRRQPGQVLDNADPRRVVLAVEQAGGDEVIDLCWGDGSVADAPLGRRHLDQRLQPQHSSRAVADQLDWTSLPGRGMDQGVRHLVCADRSRRGIPRHVNRHRRRRRRAHCEIAFSRISDRRASSSLPCSRPFTCAAGPSAQLPRQKTCSAVTEPSLLVSPIDTP